MQHKDCSLCRKQRNSSFGLSRSVLEKTIKYSVARFDVVEGLKQCILGYSKVVAQGLALNLTSNESISSINT